MGYPNQSSHNSRIVVEPVWIDEHTGKRFTFIVDPDGLLLELYEQ